MSSSAADRDTRYAAWLEEHRGIPMKISRVYAESAVDRADLHQEMLLQLWRSMVSFRDQSKPSTWIYRVCLNTALTWRRDERQHRSRISEHDQLPELASGDARPGAGHEEAELVERLYAGIRELEPVDRSLLLLSLDGQNYREISEVTGMTENHVGVTLTRARAKLAERLKGVRDELE